MRVASTGSFLGAPLLLLALAVLGGCGEDDSIDRSSPTAVFDAAMVALSKSDLEGLWPLLTPAGKARVENDLRQLQVSLRDEGTGAYVFEGMRRSRPDLPVETFERARSGTLGDVWRFFLVAKPRSPTPKKGALVMDPGGQTMSIGYEDSEGTLRLVKLRKDAAGWRIEELPL
jgi:hypothetical protein